MIVVFQALCKGDLFKDGAKNKAKISEQVSLQSCSSQDKYSKLLYKIATQLGRSCEIAKYFLSSVDNFISELQNNLSKLGSTQTPVEKKSKLITTILNYFENLNGMQYVM
ncbi:hypothetical protein [Candidatus Marithrix sp. Canyon 246]|uniref:hypothetical protein n=1 Tax=Candidatus Marithrix sp. Canyon 246 TaxID=1827136 RepID=UPI00084A1B5E|nr:hypothetical protein [Candidatus Marithrix sp. Canyon 246]